MSNFSGLISELPNLRVDNFQNLEGSTYFLSHCHTDHMRGLRDAGFISLLKGNPDVFLYCSSITKLIIQQFWQLKDVMHKVKVLRLPFDGVHIPATEAYTLPYAVTVSMIPAGHCPGSVMFLYETASKVVLFTGDFRIAEGDTKKFNQLHIGKTVKSIDCIYLDATFFSEDYWHFAHRDESIQAIVEEIQVWLRKDPKHCVKIMLSAKYGQEAAIIAVSEALRCKVHVPNAVYNIYLHIPEVLAALTSDCSLTRIHADYKNSWEPCVARYTSELLEIYPTAQAFKCKKNKTPELKEWNSRNHLKVNYSSHSPGSAIEDFLLYLKPKKIIPFTAAVGSDSEFKLSKLINSVMSQWEECESHEEPEKPMIEIPQVPQKRPLLFSIQPESLESYKLSLDSSGKTISSSLDDYLIDTGEEPSTKKAAGDMERRILVGPSEKENRISQNVSDSGEEFPSSLKHGLKRSYLDDEAEDVDLSSKRNDIQKKKEVVRGEFTDSLKKYWNSTCETLEVDVHKGKNIEGEKEIESSKENHNQNRDVPDPGNVKVHDKTSLGVSNNGLGQNLSDRNSTFDTEVHREGNNLIPAVGMSQRCNISSLDASFVREELSFDTYGNTAVSLTDAKSVNKEEEMVPFGRRLVSSFLMENVTERLEVVIAVEGERVGITTAAIDKNKSDEQKAGSPQNLGNSSGTRDFLAKAGNSRENEQKFRILEANGSKTPSLMGRKRQRRLLRVQETVLTESPNNR